MSVIYKLKSRASQRARAEVARAIEDRFHRRPEPVFPDTAVADLAQVFALHVPDPLAGAAAEWLTTQSAVEYAEVEPRRKLS